MKTLRLILSLALSVMILTGCSKNDDFRKETNNPLLIQYENGRLTSWDATHSGIRVRIISGNGSYKISGKVFDKHEIEFEDLIGATFGKDERGDYCELKLIKPDWSDSWVATVCITDKSGQMVEFTIAATNTHWWV
ncbi:MAG: hypothetical protein ACK5LF_12475 [Bacteroides xylanisolvens]